MITPAQPAEISKYPVSRLLPELARFGAARWQKRHARTQAPVDAAMSDVRSVAARDLSKVDVIPHS